MFAFGPGQQAFRFPITSNLHLTPARISCSFVDAVPRSIYGGVADVAFGRVKFSLHAPWQWFAVVFELACPVHCFLILFLEPGIILGFLVCSPRTSVYYRI